MFRGDISISGMFVDMHHPAPSSSIPPQALPPWMHNALQDTHLRYPYDAFDVTAHLRQNPSTGGVVTVFRMICGDCPGTTPLAQEIHCATSRYT
ncbi:hypothetical protein C2E23DRAFT_66872 [Lenzites betulinus]|nr:hypothetical protein C2E23DRAFT_66872 [Lenzites betulinus]